MGLGQITEDLRPYPLREQIIDIKQNYEDPTDETSTEDKGSLQKVGTRSSQMLLCVQRAFQ